MNQPGAVCVEGLLRLPHLSELAFLTLLELLFWLVLHAPPRPARVLREVAFQLALLFIRSDVRLGLLALYLFWYIARNWPWKKWRDQAAQRLNGLTEVMRASIQRQQREAMS